VRAASSADSRITLRTLLQAANLGDEQADLSNKNNFCGFNQTLLQIAVKADKMGM
jgi:hypothetical protein